MGCRIIGRSLSLLGDGQIARDSRCRDDRICEERSVIITFYDTENRCAYEERGAIIRLHINYIQSDEGANHTGKRISESHITCISLQYTLNKLSSDYP